MKSKARIIAFIAIFSSIFLYFTIEHIGSYVANAQEMVEQSLDMGRVFMETGCEWIKTHINTWAIVGNEFASIEELEDMGIDGAKALGLEDYQLRKDYREGVRQVSIKGIDNKGTAYDIIISNTGGKKGICDKEGYETHLIINALMDSNLSKEDPQLIHIIESYFTSIEATPKVSTTYTGTFQGQLTRKEKKKIIHDLIQHIDGDPDQTMEDGEIISVAGYSPIVSTEPIENINFHIALRYSEHAHRTYLWLGSPIITIEY